MFPGRSIRSHQLDISIRDIAQKATTTAAAAAVAASASVATGSLAWMPNTNVINGTATTTTTAPETSSPYDVGTSNSPYNNDFGNINTDVYNQIANGYNDYNGTATTTMPYNSYPFSSFETLTAASSSDVEIYYATWSDLVTNGWCIAWLVLLAALAQGALSQASTHILNMTGIRIKTSLQGLIYRKTLLLNATCIDTSSGRSTHSRQEAVTTTTNNSKEPKRKNDSLKSNGNDRKSENGVNSNCSDTIPITNTSTFLPDTNKSNEDSSSPDGPTYDILRQPGNATEDNNNDLKSKNDNCKYGWHFCPEVNYGQMKIITWYQW